VHNWPEDYFLSSIFNFLPGPDFKRLAADTAVKIFGVWLTENWRLSQLILWMSYGENGP